MQKTPWYIWWLLLGALFLGVLLDAWTNSSGLTTSRAIVLASLIVLGWIITVVYVHWKGFKVGEVIYRKLRIKHHLFFAGMLILVLAAQLGKESSGPLSVSAFEQRVGQLDAALDANRLAETQDHQAVRNGLSDISVADAVEREQHRVFLAKFSITGEAAQALERAARSHFPSDAGTLTAHERSSWYPSANSKDTGLSAIGRFQELGQLTIKTHRSGFAIVRHGLMPRLSTKKFTKNPSGVVDFSVTVAEGKTLPDDGHQAGNADTDYLEVCFRDDPLVRAIPTRLEGKGLNDSYVAESFVEIEPGPQADLLCFRGVVTNAAPN